MCSILSRRSRSLTVREATISCSSNREHKEHLVCVCRNVTLRMSFLETKVSDQIPQPLLNMDYQCERQTQAWHLTILVLVAICYLVSSFCHVILSFRNKFNRDSLRTSWLHNVQKWPEYQIKSCMHRLRDETKNSGPTLILSHSRHDLSEICSYGVSLVGPDKRQSFSFQHQVKEGNALIAIANRVTEPISQRTDRSPYIQDVEMAKPIPFLLGRR